MNVKEDQLKEFLLDSRLVSKTDLESAEEEAGKKGISVGEALLNKGKISEEDLRCLKANIFGVPYIDLKGERIDYSVLSLIPEPIARISNIVAFKKTDKGLEVAMLDVEDLKAIDFVKRKTGLKIVPRLTDPESIKSALVQYQGGLKKEFGDAIKEYAGILNVFTKTGIVSGRELEELSNNESTVRMVDTLIRHAIIQDASNVHIEPTDKQVLVRYRIDGVLHDAMTLPYCAAPAITARVKSLARLKLSETHLPQEGRFKVNTGKEYVSFRVSTVPTNFGEKTVMRLSREGASGFTLESLGFHGDALEAIHDAMKLRAGIVLVAGPENSGKTTTLYTILDILNTPEVSISTIEDPIEHQMPRVNQVQVSPETGLTFANGLRSLMRQDPDIIMISEISDDETASLAVNAALTGHLVLSTIKADSVANAVQNLLKKGAEPFHLASAVKVVIGQRLVGALNFNKEKYTLSEDELTELGKKINLEKTLALLKKENMVDENSSWEEISFYRPSGPDGYSGRLGICEVMKISPTVSELVASKATGKRIYRQAKKEGMTTMLEDGVFKTVQGITSLEEIFRIVKQ